MTLMVRMKNLCLVAFLIMLSVPLSAVAVDNLARADSYQITGLKWQQQSDFWLCRINGNAIPVYTMYELFSPHRLIVDIANGYFTGSIRFPVKVDDGPVTLIKGAIHTDQSPPVARIELLLGADRPYSVTSSGNDILVQLENTPQTADPLQADDLESLFLRDIHVTNSENMFKVQLLANRPIQKYQSTEMAKADDHPARLVVDLPGVTTQQRHAIPINDSFLVSLVRTESYQEGTRIILDSAHETLFRYSVAMQQDGLVINVEHAADTAPIIEKITGLSTSGSHATATEPATGKTPLQAWSHGEEKKPFATVTKSDKSEDQSKKKDLSFAGYTEQKISVDFYKIDLHNVFRLIGEISGRNIVVDEKVEGSLTLALNDVPWDFVLDVVLNLKNLAKEERYNTIVISQKNDSQKSDGFIWPEREEEKLAITKEAISVTKRMEVPKEKLEARKFIRQAKKMEESGDYEGAVSCYEKALLVWTENGDLAKRITYLSLVKLGLNAKAVHYGRIAANLLPQDTEVALHTALSMANMDMTQEAKKYFDFAVRGERPTRQALASYAAFCEQNGSQAMALSLLERFEQCYGISLETLVSKARIYDKIGDTEKATKEYQAILLSGYRVPVDLEKYIKGRLGR